MDNDKRKQFPHRKDPDTGRPLCRMCGVEVKPPRRSWCGDDCVQKYLAEHDWQFVRGRVFKRDAGVCRACGCDTEQLRRVMVRAGGRNQMWASFLLIVWVQLRFNRHQDLWQADHILERKRGGTNDLANLQTLCVPCHKDKTARFSRERAQERRDARRGLIQQQQEVANAETNTRT